MTQDDSSHHMPHRVIRPIEEQSQVVLFERSTFTMVHDREEGWDNNTSPPPSFPYQGSAQCAVRMVKRATLRKDDLALFL